MEKSVIFSSKGQRGLYYGSSSVVRASFNSFLVSAIETTFLNQSGPNLKCLWPQDLG